MKIEIRAPKNKEEFKQYYQLRYDVLRKPWNQPLSSNVDDLDNSTIHIAAITDNKVVGCARLQFNNKEEAQLRYMAVTENYRNKGIGRLIVQKAEEITKDNKRIYIVLNAREIALDFYKKNGYSVTEKGELLFGSIQHWKMKKDI